MTTLKCGKCAAFYPISDSVCPSCQHPRGGMPSIVKASLKLSALFLAVFGVLFWIFGGAQSNSSDGVASDTTVVAAAISAVKANLKDPSSASFGQIARRQVGSGKNVACGTVNSKNSFGGYVGDRRFIYTHEGASVLFDDGAPDFTTAWQTLCR